MRRNEAAPVDLQAQLVELVRIAQEINVERFSIDPTIIRSKTIPGLAEVRERAEQILGELEHAVGLASDGGRARRSWSSAAGQVIPPHAFQQLEDLCFVVGAEVRSGRRLLKGLESGTTSPFGILVACEQLRSKLIRGLCAIEVALSRLIARPSQTVNADLSQESLPARRLITRFRSRLTDTRKRHQRTEERLRASGGTLAWFLGHEEFRTLPASDRLVASLLHRRINDWLRSADRNERYGDQLDHEIESYGTLLALVNQRPELIAHDLRVISDALQALEASEAGLSADTLADLRGRDDGLDELLIAGDTAQVRQRLAALKEQLESGTSATDERPGDDSRRLFRRHASGDESDDNEAVDEPESENAREEDRSANAS